MQQNTDRFTKIAADGTVLPRDATAWEAVLDNRTGLMWDVKAVPVKNGKPATVEKAAKKSTAAGFDDWRAPSVDELFALADRTRVRPAIDTEYFPDTPNDWFWSNTPYAGDPSDCAWSVNFSNGNANWYFHKYSGFVRACRVGQ